MLEYAAAGSYNASSSFDRDGDADHNNMAFLEVSMMVRVMADPNQWTAVPLAANTTVASNFQIELWQEDQFVAVDPVASDDIMLLRRPHAELVTS